MVVEVSYLTWTEDGLLRQVVYLGEREDNQRQRCGEAHRRYEPPLDTSASAHPLPMAMETWPGRMSSMFAPAIFIRPGDRIAPTATRYPAPSQPPQQERSGEGKLGSFFVAGMSQFFSSQRKSLNRTCTLCEGAQNPVENLC
jgi:hypothetical protein